MNTEAFWAMTDAREVLIKACKKYWHPLFLETLDAYAEAVRADERCTHCGHSPCDHPEAAHPPTDCPNCKVLGRESHAFRPATEPTTDQETRT